jgi:hypothetical protein
MRIPAVACSCRARGGVLHARHRAGNAHATRTGSQPTRTRRDDKRIGVTLWSIRHDEQANPGQGAQTLSRVVDASRILLSAMYKAACCGSQS